MKDILLILQVFLLVFFARAEFRFNENGEFTIVQLTDLHCGEDEKSDMKTQEFEREFLKKIKPDLVIISGDGVSGYTGYQLNLFTDDGFFETTWRKFTDPLAELEIPYAFTLGNHDAKADLNATEITWLDQTHPFSVRKNSTGIPDTMNYYIQVYSSKKKEKLALNIWLFDSGSIGCAGHEDSWGCIEQEQIEWYNKESRKIREKHGRNVHHVAFFHIPIPEFVFLADHGEIYGAAKVPICCPHFNTGFFDHVKKNGDITGMFVGHDHHNDFGGWYKDIELVYGRKSGYGSYGDAVGARVIKFKERVNILGQVKVTREHYVIYDNDTIKETKEMRIKEGPKQGFCPTCDEKTFRQVRQAGVFDYLLTAIEVIFGAILLRFLYLVLKNVKSGKMNFKTKENIKEGLKKILLNNQA